MFIHKIKHPKKGFTLVETLVSVSLFFLTVLMISQVFITVIRSERVAYALLTSENNVRNNLELMARAIRMGKNFDLSLDGKKLCFNYYTDDSWQSLCYRFNDNNNNLETSVGGGEYYSLFDPSIQILLVRFFQIGDGVNSQLSFVIQLEAQVQERGVNYSFHVETAVTSRFIRS